MGRIGHGYGSEWQEPSTGSIHTAEVLVLALNPGYGPQDDDEVQNQDYAEQWQLALTFETRTPFYLLDPAFAGFGGDLWWRRRLRDLIAVAGIDAVASRVMCIETSHTSQSGSSRSV